MHSHESATVCCVDGSQAALPTFQITHPVHPKRGMRFVLLTRRLNCSENRVMYYDENGRLHSLPTFWTDAPELDLFAQVSAGRSYFRTDDLLR